MSRRVGDVSVIRGSLVHQVGQRQHLSKRADVSQEDVGLRTAFHSARRRRQLVAKPHLIQNPAGKAHRAR